MSTYMKTNALNTAFQLLKVIASGQTVSVLSARNGNLVKQ